LREVVADEELKGMLTLTYQKFTGNESKNKIAFKDLQRIANDFYKECGCLLSDQHIVNMKAVAKLPAKLPGLVNLQSFFHLMAFSGVEVMSNVFLEKRNCECF
jgi:hypothetical protein